MMHYEKEKIASAYHTRINITNNIIKNHATIFNMPINLLDKKNNSKYELTYT